MVPHKKNFSWYYTSPPHRLPSSLWTDTHGTRTVPEAQDVTAVAARALGRQTQLREPPVVGSASR